MVGEQMAATFAIDALAALGNQRLGNMVNEVDMTRRRSLNRQG
jgi:hypothetical protein